MWGHRLIIKWRNNATRVLHDSSWDKCQSVSAVIVKYRALSFNHLTKHARQAIDLLNVIYNIEFENYKML